MNAGRDAESNIMLGITVIILTFNEEMHISRAIDSVRGIADEVLVVDSFSTDRTTDIARELGARVVFNKFINQAVQFQWALDNADIKYSWVLRLDADEVIEADLAHEILCKLPSIDDEVTGVQFNRKHIFMGRWIRRGGRYPLMLLRLWRHGFGKVENRWMDEHVEILSGKVIAMRGGFCDINLNDLSYFISKHNSYATREAVQVLIEKYDLLSDGLSLNESVLPQGARLKKNIKSLFYNRMPIGVGPFLYFMWRYVFQLGFLDGKEGLVYHFLQGFWYRFLVDAKKFEFEREISNASSNEERIDRLSALTGYILKPNSR